MLSVNTLHQIICEVLRIPREKTATDVRIHEIDTWNSLTHIELIVSLEERFHVQFTEDEIVAMTSIGAIQETLRLRGVLTS
jgi:acyl carrier protein